MKLKYDYQTDISNDLVDLLFNGNVDNAVVKEKQVNRDLLNLKNYNSMDWDNYFKFGGFPSVMYDTNQRNASKKLYYSVETVVTKDLGTMNNLTANTQTNALRLMKFLAEKYPGDISQNALANKIKRVVPYEFLYKFFAWFMMPKKHHEKSRTIFLREAVKLDKETMFAWIEYIQVSLHPEKILRKLDSIGKKILLISGDEDHCFLDGAKFLANKIKGAHIEIIEKCGHICSIENWRSFNRISLKYLASAA